MTYVFGLTLVGLFPQLGMAQNKVGEASARYYVIGDNSKYYDAACHNNLVQTCEGVASDQGVKIASSAWFTARTNCVKERISAACQEISKEAAEELERKGEEERKNNVEKKSKRRLR
jgi:hypothetical protein